MNGSFCRFRPNCLISPNYWKSASRGHAILKREESLKGAEGICSKPAYHRIQLPHPSLSPRPIFACQSDLATRRCFHHLPNYGRLQKDMFSFTSGTIQQIQSLEDLEAVVEDFEKAHMLHKYDHDRLVKPLLRLCKDLSEREKMASAMLGERILLHCLSILPEDHHERLENDSQYVRPDIDDFNVAILICGTQRSEEGAKQAARLIRLMVAEHKNEVAYLATKKNTIMSPKSPAPTMLTYKFLLRAHTLAGTFDCAVEAGQILDSMELMSGMKDEHSEIADISIERPDTQCYNMLLSSYAKLPPSEDLHILGHAKALLDRVTSTKPTDFESQVWFSYHSLLKCYEKHIRMLQNLTSEEDEIENRVNKATAINNLTSDLESLLTEFESIPVPESFEIKFAKESRFPRSWAYGVLVECYLLRRAWNGDRDEARDLKTAHSLALSMAGRESTPLDSPFDADPFKNWPERKTLISLWRAWVDSEEHDKFERIEELRRIVLDTRIRRTLSLNVYLQDWLTSEIDEAPEIVEAMLRKHISDLVDEGSRVPVHPDDARPNPKTFLLAMRAWLWSSRAEAPKRIEDILDIMENLHESTGFQRFKPNDRHFKYVLRSWLRHCESGERHLGENGNLLAAEHISLHLMKFPLKYRSDNVVSSNIAECYEIVLEAWGRQELPKGDDRKVDQLHNSVAWLNKFKEVLNAKPLPAHCNAVLRCCLRWNDTDERRKRAYQIASVVYNSGSRDASTYVLVVKTIKSCLGDAIGEAHIAHLCEIVQDAKSEGLLSQQLVWEVAEIVGPRAIQNLFDLSKMASERIVSMRSESLTKSACNENDAHLVWSGEEKAARGLYVENMPRHWFHSNAEQQVSKHSM